jgi:hypothetical protein
MKMQLAKRVKRFIYRLIFGSRIPTIPAMESVYQRIFERDLTILKLDAPRFYPVGSAANYGLLYIILRSAQDFPVKEVLELGAGQTSFLLNMLVDSGVMKATVRTIEHDNEWAGRVSAGVSHQITKTSLVPKRLYEISFQGYDFTPLVEREIELLVIDGPPAGEPMVQFSRLGAVELIEWINPARFIIVIDDAEREGEVFLAGKIEARLKERGVAYRCGNVVTNKRQVIIAGGDYIGAAYY